MLLWLLVACGPAESEPGWRDAADLPFPLQETAVVAFRGEVVVLGGIDGDVARTDAVLAWDPVDDAWRELAPLPERVHHVQAAVWQDRLFALGGLAAGFDPVASAWEYLPGDDTWAALPDLPAPRGAGLAAALDDGVHVLGGVDEEGTGDAHLLYRPDEERWEELAPLQTPRDHAAGGTVDGTLVVAGGRDGGTFRHDPSVERYDPADDAWIAGTPMPTSRAGMASAVLGGRLFAFGGEGNPDLPDRVFDEVEAYDPSTDTWTRFDPMPVPRHGMGAAAVEGVIWIPGGATVHLLGPVDHHDGFVPTDSP